MSLKSPPQPRNDDVNSSWISGASVLAALTIIGVLAAAALGP